MSFRILADIFVTNEDLTRQTGKTTALVEACKKIDGIFVTHSYEEAQMLKRKYPDVHITCPRIIKLRGERRPIIFDHYLLSMILANKLVNTTIHHQGTKYLEDQLKLIKAELANRYINGGELYIGVHTDEIQNI